MRCFRSVFYLIEYLYIIGEMQKRNTKQENRNRSHQSNSLIPIGHASFISFLLELQHHQLLINNKSYRLVRRHNFIRGNLSQLLVSKQMLPLYQDTNYELLSHQIPQSFGIIIDIYSSNTQQHTQLQQVFKEIQHIKFHNLIKLEIQQNDITTIQAFQFIDAPKLKNLNFTYNPITIVNNALAKMLFDHMDQIRIDNRLIEQLKLEKWKMPPSIFVDNLYNNITIFYYKKDISFYAKLQTINNYSGRIMTTDKDCFLKASQATNRKNNIFAALNRRTSTK